MQENRQIVFFHLLNDYSGSPKILRQVIEDIHNQHFKVVLVTSSGPGFLNNIDEYVDELKYIEYQFCNRKFRLIFRYFSAQLKFFKFARKFSANGNTIFYVNTILPIAAALYGKLHSIPVICHYHENAFRKGLIYRVLCSIMQHLVSLFICVSDYQRRYLKINPDKTVVIPNGISAGPVLMQDVDHFSYKNVLMLSSLKEYKGVDKFIELASLIPQYNFTFVASASDKEIEDFLFAHKLNRPINLRIYSMQSDVSGFYNKASIVINLTNKKYAVETFGLTAVEAMAASLPVIVPDEGGIAEMVKNGVNGYTIPVQDIHSIKEHIIKILEDRELYEVLSNNAKRMSGEYSREKMADSIVSILTKMS